MSKTPLYYKIVIGDNQNPSLSDTWYHHELAAGFYYTKEGEFIEKIEPFYYFDFNRQDTEDVYIVEDREAYEKYRTQFHNQDSRWYPMFHSSLWNAQEVHITKLKESHTVLMAFASLIHQEAGKADANTYNESYGIANATMNFLKEGGTPTLKVLEDIVLYENHFSYGVTQKYFTSFKNLTSEGKNSKYAVGAAINAICYYYGEKGYTDTSGGANAWDGIDLVATGHNNSHRAYKWSTDSKALLLQYKKERNGGVRVEDWTYKLSGYQCKAVKIVGRTLLIKIVAGRGESKKTNATRFE